MAYSRQWWHFGEKAPDSVREDWGPPSALQKAAFGNVSCLGKDVDLGEWVGLIPDTQPLR